MISDLLPIVVAIVGSGGFLGGIYALLKLRPEAGQITVTAAQGAVIVQTGVIENLRTENERLAKRVADLESSLGMVAEMAEKIRVLEREKTQLQTANTKLRARVKHLEEEIVELRGNQAAQ